MSEANDSQTDGSGWVVLVLGIGMLLALSLMPAVLGPMMAPRLLPTVATVLCPADSVGAETQIVASRGRRGKGTSYSWYLRCEQPSGAALRAPEARTNVTAWALFNGIVVAAIGGSALGYRALDKRLRRRATP